MRSQGALSGKCQRVVVAHEEPSVEPETRPTQRKTSSNEVLDLLNEDAVKVSVSQKSKKPDLSKYMDDNLRNFDLLVKRKERSSTCSSGENTSHSTSNKSSKEQKITESSLSAAVKENKVKEPVATAHSGKTETPSKRAKNKPAASKFSIDAVDSPKGKAVPVVSSSLASAIARSAMARTKTTSAISEAPVTVTAKEQSTSAKVISTKSVSTLNTSVENSGCPADNQHTSTSTNTRALTQVFKSTTNATDSEPAVPAPTVAETLEASKSKRVSFIAPQASILVESAPSGASEPSATPKHSQRTAQAQASVSRHTTSSNVDSSASGSRGSSVSHQSQSQQSVESASSAPLSGGILSDPARFVEVNGRQYIRLNVLGKGGSSCVYRIIGVDDGQIYAYKRVEVRDSEDTEAVFDSYANEIALLKRLSATHNTPTDTAPVGAPAQSRIIELIDSEVRRDRNYISMILEAGDIDLAKVLTQKNSRSVSNSGVVSGITGTEAEKTPQALLDPFFARMVWREMLEAVDHIHQHRIVHGMSNFLFSLLFKFNIFEYMNLVLN